MKIRDEPLSRLSIKGGRGKAKSVPVDENSEQWSCKIEHNTLCMWTVIHCG